MSHEPTVGKLVSKSVGGHNMPQRPNDPNASPGGGECTVHLGPKGCEVGAFMPGENGRAADLPGIWGLKHYVPGWENQFYRITESV